MAFKKWLIGAMAHCQECDFNDENFNTAQKAASKHHKKTGHNVHIETVYSGEYKS